MTGNWVYETLNIISLIIENLLAMLKYKPTTHCRTYVIRISNGHITALLH
jgi:hypothetical protein